MKKLIILLVMFLPFCLKAQQAQKIAYVNVGEVMMAMPEADKAETDLVAFRENFTKELNTMQDEFNKKYQAYVAERDSLTENIRLKRESDLTDLQQRTQNYMQQADSEYKAKQEELFKPIQDKVASAIKAVGDEKGYTFIITPEVLLYVNPNAENATAAVKAKLGIQ